MGSSLPPQLCFPPQVRFPPPGNLAGLAQAVRQLGYLLTT